MAKARGKNGGETDIATELNDLMFGTDGDDTIDGLAGDDWLFGGGGDDTLNGGAGNDKVDGGDGDDFILGSLGEDKLTGGAGADTFLYTDAAQLEGDKITDFEAGDTLDISTVLAADDGATYELTQKGPNVWLTVTTSDGETYSLKLDKTDVATVEGGLVTEMAGPVDPPVDEPPPPSDTVEVTGSYGDIEIRASADNELLDLNDYDSDPTTEGIEITDASNIGLISNVGFDGVAYDNVSVTGDSTTAVAGTDFDDYFDFTGTNLYGIGMIDMGDGNDTFIGSTGDDTVYGGRGNDTLDGGDGSDTYVFGENSGGAFQTGGFDTITDTGTGAGDYDMIVANADGTQIGLTSFGPGSGIEEISSGGFANVTIVTNNSTTLDFSDTTLTGIEKIFGSTGDDTVIGSAGDDTILSSSGNDTVDGGAGNDTLRGGTGNDTIDGGAGNDFLHGATGVDILNGGDGDDVLYSGGGGDTVTGGAGADTFVYDSVGTFDWWTGTTIPDDPDTITDFNFGEDKIDLTALTADGSYTVSVTDDGTDATVQVTEVSTGTVTDMATLSNTGDTSGWTDADWLL